MPLHDSSKKPKPVKRAPAKKAAPVQKKTAAAAPAKKTSTKKASSSNASTKVSLGDTVFVPVDPRWNNGVVEAPATVVNVLNVKGESRVNLRVHLDSDAELHLRNVLVVGRSSKKDVDGNVAYATAPK